MPLPTTYISAHGYNTDRGVKVAAPQLVKQTFTAPSTADADGASVSHAGASAAGTTSMTLGGALASGGVVTFATPRNVVIVVTHATAVVAMNGTITGTDMYGKVQTEDWSVTATGTSKTFTGAKAFKTITAITETIAATAAANSIIAGEGVKLGLAHRAAVPSCQAEMLDAATATAGTTVAASTATTADPRGTYSPNSAPNGTRVFVIYYISDQPELTK